MCSREEAAGWWEWKGCCRKKAAGSEWRRWGEGQYKGPEISTRPTCPRRHKPLKRPNTGPRFP